MRERMVNQSEIALARSPTILKTTELGSCVAIALYDTVLKIGALGHILLPSVNSDKNTNENPGKFADLAIQRMVEKLQQNGSTLDNLRAKIVGGALVLRVPDNNNRVVPRVAIGRANVQSARKILKTFGIPIIALDVGGNHGRRIRFNSYTGKLTVETTRNGSKEM